MGGITGRLYQQFAITIAISVLLSVINALTLSPALAALLLKPPTGKKSLLTPFYNGFNKVFGWTDRRATSASPRILIRKMFRSLAFIGVLMYVTVVLVQRIPGGFVPEEDQGYILVNALLPDAASLERTDAVMRKAEAILAKNEAVEGFNTITGYSLLTGAYSSNMGFFFVQLKPWEDRHSAEAHANGVVAALNRAFAQEIPEARRASPSGRPRFPGSAPAPASRCSCRIAAADRRSIWRSRPQRFMEAARKRPEIGRINTLYRAERAADLRRHRSQQGAQVRRAAERREHDARRAARQLLRERLQPVRPRLQGLRAGRAGVPPRIRSSSGCSSCKNQAGGMVPLDTLVTTAPERRTGVHQPLQPVPHGGAHRCARGRASRRRRRSTRSKRRRARCCRRT